MAEQVTLPSNGYEMDPNDTFERDLKEMLRDGPDLNDMSSTVQSGAGHTDDRPESNAQPRMYNQNLPPATGIPKSRSMPNPTTNIPLSSHVFNGSGDVVDGARSSKTFQQTAASKLDSLKNWSINTYKCTKQLLAEKMGKGSRTVDLELEAKIEALRDTQRKYSNVLRLSRALTNHFYHVVQTQRALGDDFADLAQKSPDLQEEFGYNAETQKTLCKNGETLLGAMNFFTSSVSTLVNKTIEDSLETIKRYESARIEYDAYRTDMEALSLGPKTSTTIPKLEESKKKFDLHKEKFDKLRSDVGVKLQFLEENKVKVMHKQLLLFHNAISAYFSGNAAALEATLKQFNIRLKSPNSDVPSWLEQ